MQIAVHILGYNVSKFIQPVLENVSPFVDKIYIAYPRKPFGYLPDSRETRSNPTSLDEILSASESKNVEIIEGDWLDEESMRNACLDRAKAEGFDWLLTQDADEFYEEKVWEQIRRILLRHESAEHFITTWYNFWKSSHYVLTHPNGDIKCVNAGFALRCKPHLRFRQRRLANVTAQIIDCPCFHYGYVMSDEEMAEKLYTWSHANEVDAERWFNLKWRNWRSESRFLHPISPTIWSKAIRFPHMQPDFANDFALPVNESPSISSGARFQESVYDLRFSFREMAKRVKKDLNL